MIRNSDTITVRGLAPGTKQKLRLMAAERGHSMEEEVRQILLKAANENRTRRVNLAEEIAAIVDPIGGFELDIPARGPPREPPRFDD